MRHVPAPAQLRTGNARQPVVRMHDVVRSVAGDALGETADQTRQQVLVDGTLRPGVNREDSDASDNLGDVRFVG